MEIIKYVLEDVGMPENFYKIYGEMPFAIFDIETTGLNPFYNKVILIGILYYNGSQIILEQLFCRSKKEEINLLTTFIDKIKDFPLVISYNGDNFDIPFLSKRIELNKMNAKMPNFCSLDLLKIVRSYQKKFDLENCKLKTLERFLGIQRNDMISGEESVKLYNQYELTGDKELRNTILLHNHDDLKYLMKSLVLLDRVPHGELLSQVPWILRGSNDQLCYIRKTLVQDNILCISGSYLEGDSEDDVIIHKKGFSYHYLGNNKTFSLQIPLYKGYLPPKIKCLYIDTNDYPFIYLPVSKAYPSIPNHLALIKEDKTLIHVEISAFTRALMLYVLDTSGEISYI